MSVDRLLISTDSAFTIESVVVNHDYEDYPVEYEWKCFNKEQYCDFIVNSHDNSFNFTSGIPNIGEYLITLTVVALNQSANASATIDVMEPNLPILQIVPVNRVINQDSSTKLLGKAFRVAPSCSVTWYFVAEGLLNTSEPHGVAISETYTVFSLEENFLSELADLSNDTTSVEIQVDITSAGRARFLVECNCTSSSNCESIDATVTYAELHFQINESPKAEDLMVSPETGSALETLFQIRSRAKDFDRPLRYSFYCAIGPNVTLLLGSYLEYDMVETFLPFVDGETLIWVEVCDALGACSKSETSSVQVRPSSGKTFDSLIEYTRAFIRRCEIICFMHVAMSAAISYTNAGQLELAGLFMRTVLESLPALHSACSLPQYRYADILGQLAAAGFHVTPLLA
ncbi:uncharacterized protein [Maniola hyperantus]|uniref:uncharacterized protein n=1 Tax=Aphantopus hyperantus TaxID=2795564 RepID=UPI00374A6DF1